MDGLKRYVNDDRFRVDGDKNMRLLAFAFTIVFVWTGSRSSNLRPALCNLMERCRQLFRSRNLTYRPAGAGIQ